jgi:hypothetical protein
MTAQEARPLRDGRVGSAFSKERAGSNLAAWLTSRITWI